MVTVDAAFRLRADDQLFHVHVRRVEEAALIAYRQHCQGVGLAHGGHARAFNRIDGNIHRIAAAGTDPLADKQHRRLVNFAFANHDGTVDIDLIQHDAHGVDCRAVGGIFIAAPQPLVAGQRGGLGHARKFDGKFSFHNTLVVEAKNERAAAGYALE